MRKNNLTCIKSKHQFYYKLAITILFVLAFHSTSFAGIKTQKCISLVESTYQNIHSLSSTFTQNTKIELTGQTIKRSGILLLKETGKFRMEYLSPSKKIYISDGKTLWTYDPTDKSSLLSEDINSGVLPKPALSFLNGFDKLTNDYYVKKDLYFKNSFNACSLKLTPKKPTNFDYLLAQFAQGLLKQLVIYNKSGNISHYKFSNTKLNIKLNDSKFKPSL